MDYKEQLVNEFQERITEIVEKVDPDFYKALNVALDHRELPFKFETLKHLGRIVFLVDDKKDGGFDALKIINQYDLYSPGMTVKSVFETASVHDLIHLVKILPELDKAVDEFNAEITRQIQKATEAFRKR